MPGPDGLQMLGFCLVVCGLCACGGRWRGSTFFFSTLVLNAFVGLRPNWLSSLSQVAMLSRDEEHLLKQHLSLWREIGDCFLIGLDSRNKDSTQGHYSDQILPASPSIMPPLLSRTARRPRHDGSWCPRSWRSITSISLASVRPSPNFCRPKRTMLGNTSGKTGREWSSPKGGGVWRGTSSLGRNLGPLPAAVWLSCVSLRRETKRPLD